MNQENEILNFMFPKFKTFYTDIINIYVKLMNEERLLLDLKERLYEGPDLF